MGQDIKCQRQVRGGALSSNKSLCSVSLSQLPVTSVTFCSPGPQLLFGAISEHLPHSAPTAALSLDSGFLLSHSYADCANQIESPLGVAAVKEYVVLAVWALNMLDAHSLLVHLFIHWVLTKPCYVPGMAPGPGDTKIPEVLGSRDHISDSREGEKHRSTKNERLGSSG